MLPARGWSTRWASLAALAVALVALVVPVVVDLASHGDRRVFGYIAIDAFYYQTVARNAVDLGQWTFDQSFPTNGYHPLWQWAWVGLLRVGRGLGCSDAGILVLVVLVGLALIAGALVLVAGAMLRAHGRVSPWLLLAVPGVVALTSTPLYQPEHDVGRLREASAARPVVGTLWSYANGMESGLVLLCFAALLLRLVVTPRPRSTRGGIALGLLAGALMLARLDHGVFSLAVLGGVAISAWVSSDRRERRAAAAACLAFAAVLASYLVYNELAFDAAFPISGARKSTFPRLTNGNIDKVIKLLVDPGERWLATASRQWHLVVPPLVAMLYLPHALRLRRSGPVMGVELRPGRSALDRALVMCVPGLVLLFAYDFCFVSPTHQGHWYFPVTSLLCSLFVIRMLDHTAPTRRWLRRPRWLLAWLLVATTASIAYFSVAHHRPKHNDDIARYYLRQGPQIRDYYAGTDARFIEFYDALFAASTGLPTMNGYGLVLDAEGHEALDEGRNALVRVAIARGYDRVVSFNLQNKLPEEPTRSQLVRYLSRYFSAKDLRPYDLVLEYRSRFGSACVIRLVTRGTSAS